MKSLKQRAAWIMGMAMLIVASCPVLALAEEEEYVPALYDTAWALLPPVVAIGLALITKEVYSSLFIGIVVGGLLYSGFGFEGTFVHVLQDGIIMNLSDSYNVGIWGTSICGGEILDSAQGLPESAYLKHCTKEGTEQLKLTFEQGELKAINGERYDDPIKAIQKVEEIGAAYAIGRDMHVGDTIIGIKGRVGFEAAAPMLIIGAHKFLEKYTLSKWQQYWKDQVANWYGMFLHESEYLEPVMRDIEAMLTSSQRNVNGTAILELRP